jgi:DNA topoisomerase-3
MPNPNTTSQSQPGAGYYQTSIAAAPQIQAQGTQGMADTTQQSGRRTPEDMQFMGRQSQGTIPTSTSRFQVPPPYGDLHPGFQQLSATPSNTNQILLDVRRFPQVSIGQTLSQSIQTPAGRFDQTGSEASAQDFAHPPSRKYQHLPAGDHLSDRLGPVTTEASARQQSRQGQWYNQTTPAAYASAEAATITGSAAATEHTTVGQADRAQEGYYMQSQGQYMWHGPQERDQGRGGPVALGQQLQQLSLAAQLQISGPSASRSVLGTVEVHHTEPPQTPETKLTAAELHTMYYQDQAAYFQLMQQLPPEVPGQEMAGVLMVAETPAAARLVAECLSGSHARMRQGVAKGLPVHEFFGAFMGQRAHIHVTAIQGRLSTLDFQEQGTKMDELRFFAAPCRKRMPPEKMTVLQHLQHEAEGCHFICFWFDCHPDGEANCFDVLATCKDNFQSLDQVFRARFSALTSWEIKHAYRNLGRLDIRQALAVDGQQEIDLKAGMAFSRFLAGHVKLPSKMGEEPSTLVYGCALAPPLWLCVQRHLEIQQFRTEPYWTLMVTVTSSKDDVLELEWGREKVFDYGMANKVLQECQQYRQGVVESVSISRHEVPKPMGLNIMQLLKTGSSSLGLSPAKALQAAESLYQAGYISYPRTESTKYADNFNFMELLQPHVNHPNWGKRVSWLMRNQMVPPTEGKDAGDHPPIVPTRVANRTELSREEWRLYDYITRHFIASLMPNTKYTETKYVIAIGNERFHYTCKTVEDRGFMHAMPWKTKDMLFDEKAKQPKSGLQRKDQVLIQRCVLETQYTSPKEHLLEGDLVEALEKHGIGTDGAMAHHIQSLVDNKYCTVDTSGSNRHMVPTDLGRCFVKGFSMIDDTLVKPDLRAYTERTISLTLVGQGIKQEVVDSILQQYHSKFRDFRRRAHSLQTLFQEAEPVQEIPEAPSFPGTVPPVELLPFQVQQHQDPMVHAVPYSYGYAAVPPGFADAAQDATFTAGKGKGMMVPAAGTQPYEAMGLPPSTTNSPYSSTPDAQFGAHTVMMQHGMLCMCEHVPCGMCICDLQR